MRAISPVLRHSVLPLSASSARSMLRQMVNSHAWRYANATYQNYAYSEYFSPAFQGLIAADFKRLLETSSDGGAAEVRPIVDSHFMGLHAHYCESLRAALPCGEVRMKVGNFADLFKDRPGEITPRVLENKLVYQLTRANRDYHYPYVHTLAWRVLDVEVERITDFLNGEARERGFGFYAMLINIDQALRPRGVSVFHEGDNGSAVFRVMSLSLLEAVSACLDPTMLGLCVSGEPLEPEVCRELWEGGYRPLTLATGVVPDDSRAVTYHPLVAAGAGLLTLFQNQGARQDKVAL